MSPGWDEITTIALYDGKTVKAFVNGENLRDFRTEIRRFKQIVTYNGKCFDIPFLRVGLKSPMDHADLDLRYILHSLGYKGGLKGCERALGVSRKGLEDVNGFMAVLFWREYKRGNRKALETLLAYNMADAVNLEILMVKAYNERLACTPFGEELRLTLPGPPEIPYKPEPETDTETHRLDAAVIGEAALPYSAIAGRQEAGKGAEMLYKLRLSLAPSAHPLLNHLHPATVHVVSRPNAVASSRGAKESKKVGQLFWRGEAPNGRILFGNAIQILVSSDIFLLAQDCSGLAPIRSQHQPQKGHAS